MNSFERKTQTVFTFKQALEKAAAWCAYQERCQLEVRQKLRTWGIWDDLAEQVIAELISLGFLNEERFACLYAGGKFRIKKWGRVRIQNELRKRQISDYCMRKALEVIKEEDYLNTLKDLLEKYWKELKGNNPAKKRFRLQQYAISKGYERELVMEVLGKNN